MEKIKSKTSQARNRTQTSGQEMAEKMSCSTPMSKVLDTVRKIKGKPPRKIYFLEENGRHYTSIPGICNKLATNFEKISQFTNYCRASQTFVLVLSCYFCDFFLADVADS